MTALKEIDYRGDLTYEIHRYTASMPDALVPTALACSVEVGQYLLSWQVQKEKSREKRLFCKWLCHDPKVELSVIPVPGSAGELNGCSV